MPNSYYLTKDCSLQWEYKWKLQQPEFIYVEIIIVYWMYNHVNSKSSEHDYKIESVYISWAKGELTG